MVQRVRSVLVATSIAFVASSVARGQPCDPCDSNCDAAHDSLDVSPFVELLLTGTPLCTPCAADLNADGVANGQDVQPFVDCLLAPASTGACCVDALACTTTTESACTGLWLGDGSTCGPAQCAIGTLTAYRPQHGTGYFPFSKTAVAEVDEESATLGPGIRINAPGDADPQGEDDLIEVLIQVNQPVVPLALRRTDPALHVWTTRLKSPGSEITFVDDRTGSLPVNGSSLTLWVEWASAAHGQASLILEPLQATITLDTLAFHTFHSIVEALGGEGQVPSVPVDLNHGTFVLGISLYGKGYDVFLHDEDDVGPNGLGSAYSEVVDAIMHRGVDEVSIFGYSHGGGSTHDLANRLDVDRAGIGVFEIVVTSYVDGVENNSDIDIDQENRRPPSTQYHASHYQVGSFTDFFLDGGPVPNSEPPPTGLNVETTPWGAGSTHFVVDDYVQVRDFIQTNLVARVTR